MNISIYGKTPIDKSDLHCIALLIEDILKSSDKIKIWNKLYEDIKDSVPVTDKIVTFSSKQDIADSTDILLSLGGDGTMLDTVDIVLGTDIAVLGINLGHLGFLTTAGRKDIGNIMSEISEKRFSIEQRTVLETEISFKKDQKFFAANEVCFLSADRGSIIDLEVFINGKYLTTYSGDGVITATPTGSTAYSLSCNGPIITPENNCLCITPVAPHNLTFRPLIISDNDIVKIHIPDTEETCKILIDGHLTGEYKQGDITIKKSPYKWKLVRLENQNFFKAITNKLMWGTTPVFLSGNM